MRRSPLRRRGSRKRTQKGDSLPKLRRRLDVVFSEYIRRRDTREGYCLCITCRKPKQYGEVDAGHFCRRGLLATRYDERNVNAQCRHCNRGEDKGETFEHGLAIDRKWGKGTAEELYNLSHAPCKPDRDWYERKIVEYRDRVKALAGGLAL